MPIRPENKNRYPKNWKQIRENILERAGNKCEQCGIENNTYGVREEGVFYKITEKMVGDLIHEASWPLKPRHLPNYLRGSKDLLRVFKIVLTIAHLDHTPENCDPENLRALCQKCHNAYDAPMRARGRRKRNYVERMSKLIEQGVVCFPTVEMKLEES